MPDLKPCPACGEMIQAVARKCRFCGEYLDPSARPPAQRPDAAESLLLPVGRPVSAIAAGYLGLFAFFPGLGLVTGILAVVFGVMALRQLDKDPALLGRGRAWFGILAGGGLALLQAVVILIAIAGAVLWPGGHR